MNPTQKRKLFILLEKLSNLSKHENAEETVTSDLIENGNNASIETTIEADDVKNSDVYLRSG